MSHRTYRQLTILIAEDDDGHAELIREQLEAAGVCNPLRRFRDGEEVWQYLDQEPKRSGEGPAGWLLLLDIRMPRVDGIEVLRRVKMNPHLCRMPVVMLTTTDDPREIDECYRLGCNFYVTKPVDFSQFAETLNRLGLFIQIVSLPAH